MRLTKDESSCGLGLFGIKSTLPVPFLQPLARPIVALILISTGNLFTQLFINGLYSATLSTIEKRFQLQSKESGTFSALFSAGYCLSMVISLIIGEKIHRTRWIGIGMFGMALGTILFSISRFVAPEYVPSAEESFHLCGNLTSMDCTEGTIRDYRFLFIASLVAVGFCKTPLFSYGISYLDEHCSEKRSAIYNGVFFGMGAVGPVIGYTLGGGLLELFTQINGEHPGMTVDSSGWIGAWWLGYIICAVAFAGIGFSIFLLPKKLPDTEHFRSNRDTQVQKGFENSQSEQNFFTVFILLIKNKTFVLTSIAQALITMFLYGFNTFAAKYMESQFGISPFTSSLVNGTIAAISTIGGFLVSGVIISKLKLQVPGMIKYLMIASLISTICSFGMLLHCPNENFSINTAVIQPCNDACNCTKELYQPICGSDDLTYFAPCHAGCDQIVNHTIFTDCTCIDGDMSAKLGKCSSRNFCTSVVWYSIMLALGIFTSVLNMTPNLQIRLRCVAFSTRVRALCISHIIIDLFGPLPGRIISGAILDLSCEVWQTDCGEQGSCVVYDRWLLARNMTILMVGQTCVILILHILIWWVYEPTEKDEVLVHNNSKVIENRHTLDQLELE